MTKRILQELKESIRSHIELSLEKEGWTSIGNFGRDTKLERLKKIYREFRTEQAYDFRGNILDEGYVAVYVRGRKE